MNTLMKAALPILVIAGCIAAAKVVIANRPEPQTRPQIKSTTSIEATRVKKSDYPVIIRTQGSVSAAREGSLVPEVAGTITRVSPNFVVGGRFREGETLLEIDPRDYEISVTLAEATFAQAKAALAEESARAKQAGEDWKRLGRAGKPSSLTLRKPQLAAANASLEGARAQVQRAQLDLDRTRIIARYDGSIRAKHVDLGQFVNKGSTLAEIYSVDTAEVRLPLNNQQLGFVTLPGSSGHKSKVTFSANIGGVEQNWHGEIVRSAGAIDQNSRQLYVIAQVANTENLATDKPPLLVGQYVQANIQGKTLREVFVIPRAALREDREVLVVDELNTLQSREVKISWKDAQVAVISDGLQEGDIISLTALGSVTNGTRVRATVDGVAPLKERNRNNAGKTNNSPAIKTAGSTNAQSGNREDRLNKLKAVIDGGGELPPAARQRFEARIAAGEPVPDWLRTHISKTAK